jgi:hypothetical protein
VKFDPHDVLRGFIHSSRLDETFSSELDGISVAEGSSFSFPKPFLPEL